MFYFFLLGTHVTMTDAHLFFFFWWPSNILFFFNRSFFFSFFSPTLFLDFCFLDSFFFSVLLLTWTDFCPHTTAQRSLFLVLALHERFNERSGPQCAVGGAFTVHCCPSSNQYGWFSLPYSLIEWIPRFFLVLMVCSQTLFLGVAASTGRQ